MTDKTPPAFPVPDGFWSGGMSLRDWFAGQALAGILATSPESGDNQLSVFEAAAHDAYAYAIAMEEERERHEV